MPQNTPTVWNYSAGPAIMPKPVLERAAAELVNWNNTAMSVMELSHRSPEFEGILATTEQNLRTLLAIPHNYRVLWMQGGATSQFSALVYNLFGHPHEHVAADYLVTGAWSAKAVQEANRLGVKTNVVLDTTASNHTGSIDPTTIQYTPAPNAAYVYYCDNETVHGVEFPAVLANVPASVPLVCDMSSNILSRTFDVSKFGLIFAGAQKNIGPAGATLVLIRDDLLDRKHPTLVCPVMMDYALCAKNNSMYNTPPTYAIYVSGLVFEWLLQQGGIPAIEKRNKEKAETLYTAIDSSNGLFVCPVAKTYRSRMNVPFRVCDPTTGQPSNDLEKRFLNGAQERRMLQLKGHRSVGGIRASLYNAMPIEGVNALVDYMREFAATVNKK
ncbi:pyridoxal phosphate-dependent transferase [Powellomyces hirtus]|nr:pyridoxal phosphate-dependent transferase [Powellomyces hirtus]